MADTEFEDLDSINQEDAELLEEFDEATDKEMDEAGDDPAKLKEIIKARTATRQRLYARAKKAEADAKALKDGKGEKGKGEAPKQQKGGSKAQTEFDYGQEAYLIAKGVEGDEERDFLLSEMNSTGKNLREILNFNYVKEQLKSIADDRSAQAAMPKSKGTRGGQSARDTVEYWIDKGELPPIEQTELRRKVVAEKIARDTTRNKFGGN